MQILVMYHSKSGNTEKLAKAIAQGVAEAGNATAVLRQASEATRDDMLQSAGIVAGSPVYFGSMAAELKATLDKFVDLRPEMAGKVGAAFATSGEGHGGRDTTMLSILQAFLIYGMIVVGDPLDATGHFGVSCEGVPTDRVLENARKLGKRVAELAKRGRG